MTSSTSAIAAAEEAPARGADDTGPRPLGSDARRAITALLRERAHSLPRTLPPRLVGAARFLSAALHASFDEPPFHLDAPGLSGARYRRRWSSLARGFGLPPPRRAQRGRCLVDALLVVPRGGTLQVLAVMDPQLGAEPPAALHERLTAIERLFARAGAPVRAAPLHPEALRRDAETCHRALAFGSLVAGRLSPAAWDAIESTRRPMPRAVTAALAASAPTALARLALTLMTRRPCPGPLQAALALLAEGLTPRQLADPASFAVRWARLVPGLREPLERAALLVRSGSGAAAPADAGRLLEHGRALAHASAAAIRACRTCGIDPATRQAWHEALGPGMPRVLLPALGVRLADEARAGRLRLHPVRVGRCYEVRLSGGTLLGRGAGPVQARVRALALVVAAGAARSRNASTADLVGDLDQTWRAVAQRLARPAERSTLVMMPEAGGGARPGPPMDLLNRGPERALEFEGALAMRLAPGRRPSARMLAPEEAVRTMLRVASAGASLELLSSHPSARAVAARLARMSALVRDPAAPRPVAIEAGGRVLVPIAEGLRSYPLARFAARPRVFTPDPDAPDISIDIGERQGGRPQPRAPRRPLGVVQCRVVLVDAEVGALLYADETGAHLREEAPLAEIEQRLRDASGLVRAAFPPAVLAVRLSDGLEPVVRRAGPAGPRIGVSVRGALPLVEVEIAGERFGGTSSLGWGAAAEALLARWPAGGEGMISIDAVTVTAGSERAPPILALYASSVARRRLHGHVARTVASYRLAHRLAGRAVE